MRYINIATRVHVCDNWHFAPDNAMLIQVKYEGLKITRIFLRKKIVGAKFDQSNRVNDIKIKVIHIFLRADSIP